MKKLAYVLAAAGLMTVGGCTNSSNAERVLEDSGYTDIQITGYSLFGCAEDDDTCTGFTATAPNGRIVSGAVGAGFMFKGATVRIF